ncbi:MAG: endolytic transglycosylase MltG [Acidobacteria bacterium]|nr:endolytic transglycosylase MltG [Acidobacteriota bacterium]
MKRLRLFFLTLAFLIVPLGGVTFWANQELHASVSHTQENQYIEIPRGSSPDEIINRLNALGVIRRGWLLRLYIRLTGAGTRLKAGEYRFPSPISPLAVIHKLEEGQQRLSRLTVVEGWTRWDIAALLAHIPELKLQNADEALALMNDTSLIHDLAPEARNLEGYLFPDTYNFPPNTTAQEVVATMVRRFRQVWSEKVAERGGAGANLNPHQIVTVASLVETEAKLGEERPLVASVIYNRMKLDMPLGIDSTIIYASKLADKWKNNGKVYLSDVERDSPYNTRKVRGLPPGPVASPGARSLEAALNPAQNDYLYYVREPSRNDGAHNFYSSESDFQRGVQALREWERARDTHAQSSPTPDETPAPTPE